MQGDRAPEAATEIATRAGSDGGRSPGPGRGERTSRKEAGRAVRDRAHESQGSGGLEWASGARLIGIATVVKIRALRLALKGTSPGTDATMPT